MFVGALRALGVFAPTLSMLITRPQRRSFICGHARRVESNGGKEFLIEVLLHGLVRQILELTGSRRPGIVDDDIDLAQREHDLVVGSLHPGGVRHVGRDRDDAAWTGRVDQRCGTVERRAFACDDRNVRSRLRETCCDTQPNAFTAACDEG